MTKFLIRTLTYPLRLLDPYYHHLIFACCAHKKFEDFNLYAINPDEAEAFFACAVEALKLLKKLDNRRYIRAQKYVPNIALIKSGNNCYKASADAYYVEDFYSGDVICFAGSIVHEATHGLLHAKKFKYIKERREQHERICVAEDIAFKKKEILVKQDYSQEEKKKMIENLKKDATDALKTHWWDTKFQEEIAWNKVKIIFCKKVLIKRHDTNGKLASEENYCSGKRNGLSKYYYDNGQLRSETFYKDDKLDEKFIYYHENGVLKQKGRYTLGKADGPWQWYFPSGKLQAEGTYKDGHFEGAYKKYFENGSLAEDGNYADGKIQGICKWFYPNGKIKTHRSYENGKKAGVLKKYHENGKLEQEGYYADGKAHGPWKWYYENGQIETDQFYENGKRVGAFKSYHKNGKLEQEGAYVDGEAHGLWKWYYESGLLKTTENFK